MRRLRPLLLLLLAVLLIAPTAAAAPSSPAAPQLVPSARGEAPKWIQRIDTVVGDLPVGVVIGYQGATWYAHRDWVARAPASNEKLLLSMALLDRFPAETTLPTRVLATSQPKDGVVNGDVWIVGHGDPEIDHTDMAELAQDLVARGIHKVNGHVMGATGPFGRDWFAPGWKSYFPTYYIALPTALTFHGNEDHRGRNVNDPERRAANELTKQMKRAGIKVTRKPGLGTPPSKLTALTTIHSDPLGSIMHRMDLWSRNFYAEVLGKLLGARTGGPPGTIAKGANAIARFAHQHGVGSVVAHDASGLSYRNRITPKGIVRLLWVADAAPWGATLRDLLAQGGQGTLEGRLTNVTVRAKTGTLTNISALSGWVWMERVGDWAEFSILSSGISKTRSVQIENQIVRAVGANATPPA
jgi:D-alanyl-D-alanine carboxypeptidase/D-alanyl-D-alanine-endopeptidase (penicillin-binding protein 4)